MLLMTESPVFMTDVVKDIGNPNCFRWNIYEKRKVRDKSFYSFATRREAQNDAEKFVRKLNAIWPAREEPGIQMPAGRRRRRASERPAGLPISPWAAERG